MKEKAGTRLKALRHMAGFTREEFSALMGSDYVRLKNVEQLKVRVAEDEFEQVALKFPEFLHWVICGGKVNLEDIESSESKYVQLISARYLTGQISKDFSKYIKQ